MGGEPIILGAGSLPATSSLVRGWVFSHPVIQTAENNINRRNQRVALRGRKSHTSSKQQGVPGCGAFQPRLNGKHLSFLPICNFPPWQARRHFLHPHPPHLHILGLNEIEHIRHDKNGMAGRKSRRKLIILDLFTVWPDTQTQEQIYGEGDGLLLIL